VPGRPIRSLVAKDRSADGVRDRTGPEPSMLPGLLTRLAAPGRMGTGRDDAVASALLEAW
jgi:hypothetical protein